MRLNFCLHSALLIAGLWLMPMAPQAAPLANADALSALEQEAIANPIATVPKLQALATTLPANSADYRRYLYILSTAQMDADEYAAAEATAEQLRSHARTANDLAGQALAMSRTVLIRYRRGDPQGVIQPAREALKLALASHEQGILSPVYQAVALSCMRANEYEQALQNYQLALKHVDAMPSNRLLMQSILLNGMSILHQKMHNLPQALQYNEQADMLVRSLKAPVHQGALLVNRGYLLADQGKNQEAIQVVNQALALSMEHQLPRQEIIARINLANIYLQMHKYRAAIEEARISYVLAEKRQLKGLAANAQEKLAMALAGQGDIPAGIREMQSVLTRHENSVDKAQRLIFLRDLSSLYERAGAYQDALNTSREQLKLAELLYGEARSNAVMTLQEQFNAQASALEIAQLGRENRLKATEIENRRLQTQLGIAIGLAAILITALVLVLYRKVKHANQALLQVNEQLAGQSVRDPLTGLYNRRFLQEQMTRRLGLRRRQAQKPPAHLAQDGETPDAFLLLDVDHFKKINDQLGHAAGDAVLVEIGLRLNRLMRDTDTVMRWGGEEFLIHLHGVYPHAIDTVAKRVLDTIGSTPIRWAEHDIPVTVSVGCINLPFAQVPEAELAWEQVLQLADMAMYLSKEQGRNRANVVLSLRTDFMNARETLLHSLAEAAQQNMVTLQVVHGPTLAV